MYAIHVSRMSVFVVVFIVMHRLNILHFINKNDEKRQRFFFVIGVITFIIYLLYKKYNFVHRFLCIPLTLFLFLCFLFFLHPPILSFFLSFKEMAQENTNFIEYNMTDYVANPFNNKGQATFIYQGK